MIAAITGKFFSKVRGDGSQHFAGHQQKISEHHCVQENIEKRMAKEKLSKVSLFVESLVAFGIHVTPRFDFLPHIYHELATAEIAKESADSTTHFDQRDVSEYTLTMDMNSNLFHELDERDVSIVELEGKGRAMFCKKLVYAAERVVISCHSCYHLADVQYLAYLAEHNDVVPRIMKNGKGNIFAGTIIMIANEQYVPMATWIGESFKIELVSLRVKLEDVAQFVIIERNR